MQLDARLISSVAFEAPTSAKEEAVVNIWQKVGKIEVTTALFATVHVTSFNIFKSTLPFLFLGTQLHRRWCAR